MQLPVISGRKEVQKSKQENVVFADGANKDGHR